MAEKKKAYRRFEELTRQATASTPDAAEQGRGVEEGHGGVGPPPADALPIRLSPEVRRALEQRAAADNTTPSAIVEAALRHHLELPH